MTVAHITGAARGIGKAIALRLAQDGHHIAISDLSVMGDELAATRDEIEATGVKAIALEGDVTNQDDVRRLVSETADQLGSLDVMVANAGIVITKPTLEVTLEEYEKVHAVNNTGVFLCYTEAARQMAGHKGFGLLSAYSSSKFGVRALTQACAQEWAEHGITVNAYCPGIVDTQMWVEVDHDLGEINGVGEGESMKAMASGITLGRVSKGSDVAAFVSYLAGPDSDYMTGQSPLIDGGMLFV
jgi:meso-butanediol dehydrogenase/(S,S)-butanediol dehydrogenase/diacetyl reductase